MTIQLLYFARLREVLGCDGERLAVPATSWDVAGLLAHLRSRGGAWAVELAVNKVFRVAVNQELAGQDTHIPPGAEVAIFPPVTGG
ncbi:molybdopterin synthase sulfur carrier subunit [Chitinimonas prasina]|uniref:Molybdopterin synthase sulfur carrier subunit n=1 Tax=Chitinimonas prasina TaxID=1434937 RepID=A0ABQ5YNL5_9NEIS|nr:molybdopterin converting factor subunit 1 [Chitinimonas prasina]GLR14926.1 molybdopterin synthase sulfur carrier subunit [Chitinimonas prasina]